MAKRVHADINAEAAQAFRQALKIRGHREAQLADDKHCRGAGLCEVCDEYERLVSPSWTLLLISSLISYPRSMCSTDPRHQCGQPVSRLTGTAPVTSTCCLPRRRT